MDTTPDAEMICPLPLYNCTFSGVWTGPEGAIFEHSVRTPMVKAVLNKELK